MLNARREVAMHKRKFLGPTIAALLATAAVCALLTAGAGAATPLPAPTSKGHFVPRAIRPSSTVTLYDQTGNDSGIGIVSQNFETSFDAYDCEAADDFVVPDGAKWRVTEVDITGITFNGSGVAASENLLIYKNRKGKPGEIVAEHDDVVGTEINGSFFIDLGRGVKLKPGRYWLSFQANESFNNQGEWGWEASEAVEGIPSLWRNPGDGFATGCTDWTTETECIPDGQGDQMFALKGRAR
jgi:hypothetical protein